MAITINGTTGITTPAVTNDGAYTGDGISFADGTPSNTLVTTTGGNVGIGLTPTAASGFSANKLLEMGGASGPAVIFRPTGSTCEHTVCGAGDGLVLGATGAATASNNAIRFFTSNTNSSTTPTERVRIDSSGNLLVGKTTNNNNTVGFAVNSNGVVVSTVSSDICALFDRKTTTGQIVLFRYNDGDIGSISTNGSTTAYNTTSDYRLKENVAPMTGALATVSALKPVTYTWKSTGEASQGFIAHELQAVVPDCVTGEKDAVDADGNPVYQGIDTSFLVATLTAAIQEQQAIISDLKARIETLENK